MSLSFLYQVSFLGSVPVPRFRCEIFTNSALSAAQIFIQSKIDANLLDPHREHEVMVWDGLDERYFLISPRVTIDFTVLEYDKDGEVINYAY